MYEEDEVKPQREGERIDAMVQELPSAQEIQKHRALRKSQGQPMQTPVPEPEPVEPSQLNVSGKNFGKKLMSVPEAIKQTARKPEPAPAPVKEASPEAPVPETPKTATILGWARAQAFIALRGKHFEIAKQVYGELWKTCLAQNLDLREVLNDLVHIEIEVQGDEATK